MTDEVVHSQEWAAQRGGIFRGQGSARLWDAETGAPRGEPMKHDHWVDAVAFSPDGKTVLTGSFDKTARLWDVTSLTN